MANIEQANAYLELKQRTNRDVRQLGPVVTYYYDAESTAGQTTINLNFAVEQTTIGKKQTLLIVDGNVLREGAGNDYTYVNANAGQSSQILLAAALPAGLNIMAYRVGASIQTFPNPASVQAQLNTLVPAGSIVEWAGPSDPASSWFICDGRAISRTTYSDLFAAIGVTHGTGDGSTTFNIPDKRGVFSRGDTRISTITGSGTVATNNATFTGHNVNRTGFKVRLSSGTLSGLTTATDYYAIVVDSNTLAFATSHANAIAGTKIAITGANSAVMTQWEDPDRATRNQAAVGGNTSGVGTRQDDQNLSHTHTTVTVGGGNYTGVGNAGPYGAVGGTPPNYVTTASGGNQSNPRNIYTNFIIKY